MRLAGRLGTGEQPPTSIGAGQVETLGTPGETWHEPLETLSDKRHMSRIRRFDDTSR